MPVAPPPPTTLGRPWRPVGVRDGRVDQGPTGVEKIGTPNVEGSPPRPRCQPATPDVLPCPGCVASEVVLGFGRLRRGGEGGVGDVCGHPPPPHPSTARPVTHPLQPPLPPPRRPPEEILLRYPPRGPLEYHTPSTHPEGTHSREVLTTPSSSLSYSQAPYPGPHFYHRVLPPRVDGLCEISIDLRPASYSTPSSTSKSKSRRLKSPSLTPETSE